MAYVTRRTIAAGIAACSLLVVGSPTERAAASCAGPMITLTPAAGAAGTKLVVDGKYFADGCNDVVINGQRPDPVPPTKGVVITFSQNGRSWTLGSVDANSDYQFSFTGAVPLRTRMGPATVTAGSLASADFTVTAIPAVPVRRQPSVTG